MCTRLHKIHDCAKRSVDWTKPEEPLAGAWDFPQSSRVRHGFGVRGCAARCGLSFLSVGNYAPCGVRGLCGAVVRCFGYDKIAIEFSYIDER